MNNTNIIILIIGIIITLFGIGAMAYPNIARWINAPGGLRIKAVIAIIIGIILIISSIIISFSK